MSKYIQLKVDALVKRFQTRDPFEIADGLGIVVMREKMGNLKGCYKYFKRNRYIFINDKLDSPLQRMVCAHELAHDRLHFDFARYSFLKDITMTDMSSKPEYEANLFAALLLISDEDLWPLITMEYTAAQIAMELDTYEQLVHIRLNEFYRQHHELGVNRFDVRSDFLK